MLKTPELLKENIRALLTSRRIPDRELAFWMGHSGAWISKILSGERGVKMEDLPRMADFFGVDPWQLIAPGISTLCERRRRVRRSGHERRSGKDRRIRHQPQD